MQQIGSVERAAQLKEPRVFRRGEPSNPPGGGPSKSAPGRGRRHYHSRQSYEARKPRKGTVAGKHLIAADSREANFHAKLSSHLTDEIRICAIDTGLIHAFQKSSELSLKVRPGHDTRRVVGSQPA